VSREETVTVISRRESEVESLHSPVVSTSLRLNLFLKTDSGYPKDVGGN